MQIPDSVISEQIAQQLLSGIPQESRDQIIVKAVRDALSRYSFHHAVETAVASEAARVSQVLLANKDILAGIEAAVRDGIAQTVASLPEAMANFMATALAGAEQTSTYTYRGLLHEHVWKAVAARRGKAEAPGGGS